MAPQATTAGRTGVQTLTVTDFPSPAISATLSPNGRASWQAQSRAKASVRYTVAATARAAGLRPVRGPVRLVLRYVFPVHRRRDVDNLTTGVTKAAIDALVKGEWLDADDSTTVLSVDAVPVVEKGQRRLEIEIRPEATS